MILIRVHEEVTSASCVIQGGLLYHEKKKKEISGIGSELKVSEDAGLEKLKVIFRQKDGQGKWILVSRSHKDKRINECVVLVSSDTK